MTNISSMTNEQLGEWLAVNVMGWMLDLVENGKLSLSCILNNLRWIWANKLLQIRRILK